MIAGKNKMLFRVINLMAALFLVMLCMEALSINLLEHHQTLLKVIHGVIVVFLVIALVLVQIISRKNRGIEIAAHSQEKTEIQRVADKTALRYMNLLECAGDSIFVINASNGRLEEMNSKGSELFGYSREEMGKLDGKDLIPLHEQSLFSALVRRIVRHGAAGEECITFRRKDGSHFLGEVNAMLIDLGDEKVVQAIVRDITQKKQAEQDILWRNRKLSILNSIIARANQSLNFHTVLDMALHETMDLFGAEGGAIHLLEKDGLALVTQRNFSGPFIALVGADDPALENPCRMEANRLCIALLDGAGPCCTMAVSARDSGWRNIAGIPLFAGKRLIGVMHILARAGMEYVPDDITFFTTMGNQIGICIEHARMFGELNWKSEELLRSHRLLEKNSRQLELSRKRLEKNLARVELANQELERLDLMKNHFIGMVSHEFRTPLTSLLGSAEFLLANHATAKDDDIRQLLEIIHTSGARLNEIITNLLKVARVEGNTPSIAKTTLLLQEVLDPVREEFETVLKERGQRLILQEGMESLPFICGHRGYLEEIFTQLLANAVKFTPDGGEICVAARVADRTMLADKEQLLFRFNQRFYEQMGCKCFVQVEVRDSGIGIDADEQLKIFDKFYEIGDIRHHSTGKHKFQGKGTGMGLAIVKGMVEAHGGMVWVESPAKDAPERPGSAFFLLLPLEEDTSQTAFPFIHTQVVQR